jgi:predicted carbohydrate-binding protein with CBM48
MDPGDRWDDQVRDAYQLPIEGEERARERAITRLRRESAPHPFRMGLWWLDPEALRMRPLLGAATLLAAFVIGAWGGASWMASRGAHALRPSIAAVAGEPTAVTFVFRAPGATRVSLVGDFNGWDLEATPLARATTGDTWTVRVPLEHGLHAYAFVIDGRDWAPDPSAPLAPVATFGRRNSLLVVGEDHVL